MTEDPSSRPPGLSKGSLSVAVIVKDSDWLKAVPSLKTLAREVVAEALKKAPAWKAKTIPSGRKVEVSLCFADDAFVRDLNDEFRDKDKATNVLSFSGVDPDAYEASGEILLGDIVFALGVIEEEARVQEKHMIDHTTHLIIHGLLHLLGYTHDDEADAKEMEALEIEILEGFEIGNPYL